MRHTELVATPAGTVEVVAEGSGPALVMLPSLGRDGYEDFDTVAELLAPRHTVLRPQPRGIGASTGPLAGVSLHHMADDIARVIDALGGGRAVVLGHAFGNFVARMTAADHPRRVRGVVLAAAAARSYAPEIAACPRIAGNPDLPEEERLAALRLGFFAAGHDPRRWLHGWHPATQRMQADCREKQGVARSEWWGAGAAPLLELIPAHDPFKPRPQWDELGAELGGRVHQRVIADASHALFPEQPQAVAGAIGEWLVTIPA
jgi:pimeloyl-ACP methyl ester carboxylesterase